jgi:hypothetical protein
MCDIFKYKTQKQIYNAYDDAMKQKQNQIKEYAIPKKTKVSSSTSNIISQQTFNLPTVNFKGNNSLLSLRDPDNPQSYNI